MEREALKLALEALEESKTNNDSMEFHERKNKAIAAIQEALAQPAQPDQEPVAWMYQCTADNSGPVLLRHRTNWAESGSGLWIETPLYTAPPQREWNAALDEAASRIGEIKGFGTATQDSFAVYIKGLKR